jgi:hypothetical protein
MRMSIAVSQGFLQRHDRHRLLLADVGEELFVLFEDRLVRLLLGQGGIVLRRRREGAEDEVELDRQRFLDPYRAVVVEGRDPLGWLQVVGAESRGAIDEAVMAFLAGPSFQLASVWSKGRPFVSASGSARPIVPSPRLADGDAR